MRISPALIAILTLGCVPKTQAPVDNSWRATTPEPLAPRAFQLPEAQTATLSNGIEVSVVENHEMPLVNVRLAFDQGGWTDKDHVGLASVTLDCSTKALATMMPPASRRPPRPWPPTSAAVLAMTAPACHSTFWPRTWSPDSTSSRP